LLSFLTVTERIFREMRREKFTLLILVALPGFMIIMFFIGFSSMRTAGAETYSLLVINNDEGIPDPLKEYMTGYIPEETINRGFAADFIDVFNTSTYPGGDKRIFNVREINELEQANELIEKRDVDGLVIFPSSFSNTTLSAVNNANKLLTGMYIHEEINQTIFELSSGLLQYNGPPFPSSYNGTIQIIGDSGYLDFIITKMIVEMFVTEYSKEISSLNYPVDVVIDINQVSIRDYSIFDTIVPGMIVFGILTQAGILSAFMASELRTPNRTMIRLRLTLIKPWEYILGVSTLQLAISPIQIAVLMGMTLVLGFQPEGNVISAFIICWLVTLFSMSISFVAGSIFTSPEAAGQLVGFGVTPLAFASGCFMEVPGITLITNFFPTATGGARDVVLWDLLPTTHAVNALRSVLLYDFSFIDVIADVIAMIGLSLVLLAISILLYSKRRFTGDI